MSSFGSPRESTAACVYRFVRTGDECGLDVGLDRPCPKEANNECSDH